MADETGAPAGEGESISIDQAVALFNKKPAPDEQAPATSGEAPEASAAPQESTPQGEDAAPPEGETSGEQTEEHDPALEELPPVEPPRSWTKEEKEAFKTLPREHQQSIADRERERTLAIRRGQDEAAQIRKAAEAERAAAEQARQRYESALPTLLQAIHLQNMQDFQDVKSWDDVQKMAAEDPGRYMQWDAAQKRAQAVAQQVQAAQARQSQENADNFRAYAESEFQKLLERAPEYADPQKAPQLQNEARELFDDLGVSRDELTALWQGRSSISIHDHRVQLLIRDAMRYRAAQKAAKAAPAKPVPPVQRPGTAPAKGEAGREKIEALATRLNRTGSVQDAVALYRATRRA